MKLFPEELRLTLTPGRALLQRIGSGEGETLLDTAGPGVDLSGLENLLNHALFRLGPIRALVSDAWVRYDLIPVDTRTMDDADAQLLAEARFRRRYGPPDWPLRLAGKADAFLVAALSPTLLDALRNRARPGQAAGEAWRLARVEPIFSWLLDQADTELRQFTGWLVIDEGDVLVLAFLERGRLASVRSQYCGENLRQTLLDLLARQAALDSRSDRSVLHHSLTGRPLSLPSPWQLAPLNPAPRTRFSRISSFLMSS